MADLPFPKSLPDFQRLFPDDAACATYLERLRWPACADEGRAVWLSAAKSRVRTPTGEASMTTASDPRTPCTGGCGRMAMDGKATCGELACGSSTGNDQSLDAMATTVERFRRRGIPIKQQLEDIAREAGVDPEAMWKMSVAEFGVRVALGRTQGPREDLVDALAMAESMHQTGGSDASR